MSDIWGRLVKLGLTSRRSVIGLLTVAGLLTTYFWRLGTSPAGFSPEEKLPIWQSSNLHGLYYHPLNATHNIFLYGLQKIGYHGMFGMRAVSAVWAIIFILCFYKVLRTWFGRFIGWLAMLLFAFTPLMVLAGRSADGTIMYLIPLLVLAIYFKLVHSEKRIRLLYLSLVIAGFASLYTPGIVWLMVVGLVLARSTLLKLVKSQPTWFNAVGLVLGLIVIAPLVLAFIHSPSLIKSWALIPGAEPGIVQTLKNIGWTFLGLFWRTGSYRELQIGRLPLLNVGQIALLVFGVYAFWSRARDKSYGLLAVILLIVIASALNGNFGLLIIATVPATILAGAGLRYLHLEWRSVFPLNPIPRSLALILMSLIVALNVLYGLRYSLVAWPHTLAVRQTYVLK